MDSLNIKKIVVNNLMRVLIIVVCALFVFPLFWMLLVSVKTGTQILEPGTWFFKPTFENYKEAFLYRGLLDYLKNSFIIVIFTTFFSLIIGSLAAYGLARFDFKNRETLAFLILGFRMLPPMVMVIPFFFMAHLLDILV